MDNDHMNLELVCQLSESEIAERAYEAGQADQQIQSKEMNFDAVRKAHKAEIEGLQGERTTLLREVRTKQTTRDVECIIDRVYHPEFVVRITRTDTGEVVRERAMTYDERQGQLVGIGGKSEAVN